MNKKRFIRRKSPQFPMAFEVKDTEDDDCIIGNFVSSAKNIDSLCDWLNELVAKENPRQDKIHRMLEKLYSEDEYIYEEFNGFGCITEIKPTTVNYVEIAHWLGIPSSKIEWKTIGEVRCIFKFRLGDVDGD